LATLFDTNVWLALTFSAHPYHKSATQAFIEATTSGTVYFCRATQQSFLRLASTPAILQNYGAQGLTNQDALSVLADLMAMSKIEFLAEAQGLESLWFRLAALKTASPKVWMDALSRRFRYLAQSRHDHLGSRLSKVRARRAQSAAASLRTI
jgi:uncharacterized protein